MQHIRTLPKKILATVGHRFMSPSVMVGQMGLSSGSNVLELGNPVGFFASACLNAVGEEGNVFVAGPTAESLEKLSHMRHFPNFKTCLLADVLVGNAVPARQIDLIMLTNLLSNSTQPGQFCLALNQYLKPGGEVVLIDWDTKHERVGPDMGQRVSKEEAVKLISSCGYTFSRVLQTPGYHYGLVFKV